ncbi:DUF3427 domain-containing protein [Deinococcus radiopugnans]|uniref:DUF3427 domain-containing protein n=1 Tax=Deinococcus radiopugnans ATCC 19172 TaxID=585398 RepID=A0A5C4YBM3_9DEIO|nr:DUF3427 domain-containing protein [Deinococcus radiopugnans]MBB6015190.1 hypothetical protein [Deinococcus radiopugnans ATCC 19172]TNM73102.1 DUF3427 domain-containing protein [Deinococcus radiopugnans ATCC 19172]
MAERGAGDVPLRWERLLVHDPLVSALLRAVETNLQLQRVGEYAVVFFPEDPAHGVGTFFVRFPQWQSEQDVDLVRARTTLEKKPGRLALLRGGAFAPALRARLRTDPRLAQEAERRLEYLLACDYAERHGGVLRTPGDLTRYHGYRRSEIVNHLGVQYDPARHNTGVVQMGSDIALLTQLDTRDVQTSHQYQNRFLQDRRFFSWESQNRMVPDRCPGQAIADHRRLGYTLHLFVQPVGAGLYFYLGPVDVEQVQGSAPFTAVLKLPEWPPASLEEGLLG